jgi:hypothetical protein
MRYEKRWANGFWRVFDTQNYTTVELCSTSVEANQRVAQFNNK